MFLGIFFTSKYQITCLRSYYSPSRFSGVIVITPQSRKKRGSNFFFEEKHAEEKATLSGPWTLGLIHRFLKSDLSFTKVKMNSEGGSLAFQRSREGKVQEEVGTYKNKTTV